ncbi:MAG: hypothetical protein RLZZ262_854 [Bacteroidota bacterium]
MEINRNNYEAFLIDYLEGNLTPDAQHQVEAFLLANPDIQAECEDVMGFSLPQEAVSFDDKQDIKIDDDLDRTSILMMLAIDGEATLGELDELKLILKDADQARHFEALKATVLRPEHLEFEGKSILQVSDRLTPQQEFELQAAGLLPIVSPEQIDAWDKANLYFPDQVDWSNEMDLAAAYAEGELPAELQLIARQKAAASIVFAANVEALKKMRLQPEQITFEGKSSLKQKETRVIFFTPAIRRAAAIAAVFVIGIGIWRPWEMSPIHPTGVAENGQDSIESELQAPAINNDVASTEQPITVDTISQPEQREQKKSPQVPSPKVNPLDEMAHVEPIAPELKEGVNDDDTLSTPLDESPMQLEQNLAQEQPQIKRDEGAARPTRPLEPAAPVTLLAFLGDKLEQRVEHSAVYSFVERKKKEMFESEDNSEPVQYERLKTATHIKQKLRLGRWEVERTKRRKKA